jgi:hypothetical protein
MNVDQCFVTFSHENASKILPLCSKNCCLGESLDVRKKVGTGKQFKLC